MTNAELIAELSNYSPNAECLIFDERKIAYVPVIEVIQDYHGTKHVLKLT